MTRQFVRARRLAAATWCVLLCHCGLLVNLDDLGQPGVDAASAADVDMGDARSDGGAVELADTGDFGETGVADSALGDQAASPADGGTEDGAGGDALTTSDADGSVEASDNDASTDAAADDCRLVTHSNGVGQTWQDCAPLATFDSAEASAACGALTATGCTLGSSCNLAYVKVTTANTVYYWVYSGFGAWQVSPGSVLEYASGEQVSCQSLSSTRMWQ